MMSDFRFALRLIGRAPLFAATVVLTLGFALAATTTVFSVLDAVVLRPLPYRDPSRLAALWDVNQARGATRERMSPVNLVDYRSLAAFDDIAVWWTPESSLTDAGLEPARVDAVEVSSNFFALLGVQPAMGAGLPVEPFFVRDPQLVISHRLWQARYAGDPSIIGRTIQFNGRAFAVLGVMPAGFHFPGDTDVWQRLEWDPRQHSRAAHFMDAVARLAPGVTEEQAQRDVSALAARLGGEFPSTNQGWNTRIGSLDREIVGSYRVALLALFGAVGALLLIACLNVASLLLVRGVARAKEVAIRVSLGATSFRIARQLLFESLGLGAASIVVGLALATLAVRAIVFAAPMPIPRLPDVSVDGRAFVFAALVALGSTLFFGLGPALIASRVAPEPVLRDESRGASQGTRTRWLRRGLVGGEVALAVVLLTAAGLMLRSVVNLVREDPGFSQTSAVTVNLSLTPNAYPKYADVVTFFSTLTESLRARTDVVSVGATSALPFTPGWRMPFEVVGDPPSTPDDRPRAQYVSVTDGYFDTIGAPLLRGRGFDARDSADAAGVAIVNATFARRFFPRGDAIGRHIQSWSRNIGPLGAALIQNLDYEIVGVVGDVRNASLQEPAEPAIHTSIRQFPYRSLHLVVRGRGAARDVMSAAREEVQRIDAHLPLSDGQTLEGLVASASDRPRLLTWLMGTFAALALGLAAFGFYGLLAYAVGLRRQEISIRRALGAQRTDVVTLVAREGGAIVAAGTIVGIGGAVVAARGLASVLFGVRPTDPLTILIVGVVVFAVAMLASVGPTLQALRIDPADGLRGK